MRAARRLRRDEQVELNRGRVLEAARRVFLARGYVGATLDAIADEAGFSKGVVYSQFDSKADLFFALLEDRIAERAEENERIASERRGAEAIRAFLRLHERAFRAEPEWALLLIEFRVQAARDPALRRRYAEVHGRTVDRFARVLETVLGNGAARAGFHPREAAELLLAFGVGVYLERTVNPDALSRDLLERALVPALGGRRGTAVRLRERPGRRRR
jgi:AcrR family transcriptional regulator